MFLAESRIKHHQWSINVILLEGHLIPNDVDALSGFQTRARCILVIEKDSTFQKLIDDDVERYIGPCILITVTVTFLFSLKLIQLTLNIFFKKVNFNIFQKYCYGIKRTQL